ncbi:hypothetical protein ACFQ8W_00365 [Streptomyces sp. NPDC056508]
MLVFGVVHGMLPAVMTIGYWTAAVLVVGARVGVAYVRRLFCK